MFLELEKEYAVPLQEYLTEQNIPFTVSAIPLVKTVPFMRLEFDTLNETQLRDIYAVVNQLKTRKSPTRHRPWEDKTHTASEEFRGWWTGKATEEEVRYERED